MAPAVTIAVLLAALWLGLRWLERTMIFVPDRTLYAHPGTVGLRWEPIWLDASDKTRVRAWWIPGPDEKSPIMLCLHGNAGNLSYRTDKMRLFHDAGAAQLWVEWRGYGESRGRPSEQGLYRDAEAARLWLAMKGAPAERVVLYGESLGCGPAVELALRGLGAALILDSGFASVARMAKLVLPWLPPALVRTRFDNEEKLRRVRLPTLILHSPDDEIVPFAQAELNFAAAGGPKKLVKLKGGHNDGFLDSGPAYPAAIADFLRSYSAPPAPASPKK